MKYFPGSRQVLVTLAALTGFALVGSSAMADTTGVRVDATGDGILVTVNPAGTNVHFDYSEHCGDNKPCYQFTFGMGTEGVPATASGGGCVVQQGGADRLTGVQCPPGPTSITFKLVNGGTWSAYEGSGGEHAAGPCSPARVIIHSGAGANVINTWNGCHEVIYCDPVPGGFAGVEADATDDIHGTCGSVVKH